MPATADELLDAEGELARVEGWRLARLVDDMGFSTDDAAQIAGRFDIDVHKVAIAIAGGCSHELALRIFL